MSKHWKRSHVMQEFEKIAAEQGLITNNLNPDDKDFVGNPSKKTPVKGKRRYEPTEEYDVTKHNDLVEKAHPKTIEVADAMGSGAVVENIKQQQDVDLNIATKMPNGSLHGVHAELVKSLVEAANKLEDEGKTKEAKRIDEALEKIALPFSQSHLVKKAWIGTAIGLLTTLAPFAFSFMGRSKYRGGGKGPRLPVGKTGKIMSLLGGAFTLMSAFGNKLTSRKETLLEDLKDLYAILLKGAEKSSGCKKATELLKPFLTSLNKPLDEKGFKRFVLTFESLEPIIEKVKTLVAKSSIKLGPGRWYQFGFDLNSRIEEKLNDFEEVYKETKLLIKKAQGLGNKMDNTARQAASGIVPQKPNEIEELQKLLFVGDPDKITGEMDQNTIYAAQKLEENIDNALEKLNIKKTVKGKIIKNNELVTQVSKIKKILQLIDESLKKKD